MKKILAIFICLGSFAFLTPAQSPRKGTENLFPVLLNKKWGYINAEGDVVIKPQFEGAGEFKEGLAVAFLDMQRFEGAAAFYEGLAAVRIGDKRGFINTLGEVVIQPQWDYTTNFSAGMAAVEIGGQWGYIGKSGNVIIDPKYRTAHSFSEGLASVQIGDKWGYIDQRGEMVIKPEFDFAFPFSGGMARVEIGMCIRDRKLSRGKSEDCRFGYIDKEGRYLWKQSE